VYVCVNFTCCNFIISVSFLFFCLKRWKQSILLPEDINIGYNSAVSIKKKDTYVVQIVHLIWDCQYVMTHYIS
jgi:hypothetical protein